MTSQTFKIGINPTIINKPNSSSVNHATNWQNQSLTLDQLVESIKRGHAFSAHFKDGYRKTQNFICSDMIAADVDKAWTIDEMLAQSFVRDNAAFLYTTATHTPEAHRFRIVFLLERTMIDAKEWAHALAGLGRKLNADPTIKDSGRLFYGNSEANVYLLNKTLSDGALDELIEMGRQPSSARRDQALGSAVSYRSSKRLRFEEMIETAEGEQRSLRSLPRHTSVKCAYHIDRHHSAFVVRSANGHPGVHCMVCRATFWADDPGDYDFDAFDKLFEERRLDEAASIQKTVERSSNPLLQYFPPSPTRLITNHRYLLLIPYEPGITLVKSPKGTGKTAALQVLVSQIKEKKYSQGVERVDQCRSILLIGHRRSLIEEASWKLGLDFYLDDQLGFSSDFYGVCLDSLPGLLVPGRARKYDLILIDESEQVIRHLLSETIGKHRGAQDCFHALEFFIRNAKAVVALDADLGMLTAHALMATRRADWESRCRIIYNKPLVESSDKTLMLYENRGQLVEDLRQSIRDGKRCFVTSNSKKMIDSLSEMIEREFQGRVRQMAITSDNSREPSSIEFLKRIPQRFLEIDVLLASPSLGTGIDITFSDNASRVDCVYGFFVATVNTHTDIDQQLARVRNPSSVRVWISPQRFSFETCFDIIRDDLARASVVPFAITGYDDDGRLQYDKDNPLLMIHTHVVCASRASRKNLLKLFCALREAQGWRIVRAWDAGDTAKSGNSRLGSARESVEMKRVEALMAAPRLSDEEFTKINESVCRGMHVPREQRVAHERAVLEQTFGVTLSPEIIELDENGKLIGTCQ